MPFLMCVSSMCLDSFHIVTDSAITYVNFLIIPHCIYYLVHQVIAFLSLRMWKVVTIHQEYWRCIEFACLSFSIIPDDIFPLTDWLLVLIWLWRFHSTSSVKESEAIWCRVMIIECMCEDGGTRYWHCFKLWLPNEIFLFVDCPVIKLTVVHPCKD